MTTDPDDDLRALTRALFSHEPDTPPEDPPPPERGNVSPRESHNPHAPARDMRSFVAALFARAHD